MSSVLSAKALPISAKVFAQPRLNYNILSLARPPAGNEQFPAARHDLCKGERLDKLSAQIVGKRLTAHSEEHVAHRDDSPRRGSACPRE